MEHEQIYKDYDIFGRGHATGKFEVSQLTKIAVPVSDVKTELRVVSTVMQGGIKQRYAKYK